MPLPTKDRNMDFKLLTSEQFELLCARLLQAEGFEFVRQPARSLDIGVDFILTAPDKKMWVVEAKHSRRSVTPTAQFRTAGYQLENAKDFLQADAALLITSGAITPNAMKSLTVDKTIHVWDEARLKELLDSHTDLREEFIALVDAQAAIQRKLVEPEILDARAKELLDRLDGLKAGEDYWREWEDLCIEILNYAFIPPLSIPKVQSRSEDGLDRRDAIYSIGHGHTSWDSIKAECRTRFAVAEFKNYTHAPGQREVESIQQYLFTKAMRSFGILCSRQSPSESALKARRRAWLEFDKLIVLLSDEDLREIILAKSSGGDPSEVLDAHLNEFFTILCP